MTSRGNAQAAIFDDDIDRNAFLTVLRQTLRRFVSVYGFLDTLLVNQAATFTASFWMARTADGVL